MKTTHCTPGKTWTGYIVMLLTVLLSSSATWGFPPPNQGPKDRTPPTTPTNLQVTGVSDFSVSLSWNPSTDNSGHWFYKVVSSAGITVNVDRTQTSYSFTTGHAAGTTYSFHVFAQDGAGNKSANSNTVSATLQPAGTLPNAPVVSASHVGPTHITLSWTKPFNAGPPVRYWVHWNGQNVVIAGQTTTFTAYYVTPQSTHTFTVQARDGKGRFSAHSAALTVTTPPSDPNDHTPPSIPPNFWAASFSDGSNEFESNWSPSTDDVTPHAYIRYDIYLNGALLDFCVGCTHRTDYGVFGENHLEVTATDEAGNTSAPATYTFSIP